MKKIITITLIFFCLQLQAQVSVVTDSTFNAFLSRYKSDTSIANTKQRNTQAQLDKFIKDQTLINKTLDSSANRVDSIFFNENDFIVENDNHVSLRHSNTDLDKRVTSLEMWRGPTQISIDSLLSYMEELKKTIFINKFPQ